jgi:hypothetical protein
MLEIPLRDAAMTVQCIKGIDSDILSIREESTRIALLVSRCFCAQHRS